MTDFRVTQDDMIREQFQRGHNWDDKALMGRMQSIDRRFEFIEKQLHSIEETLELIKTTMLRADATIATIAGEVKPTLDALTSNPAVRMFLGVKKGDKV